MTRGRLLRLLLLVGILLVLPSLRQRFREPPMTITRRDYGDSVRVDSTEGVVARSGGLPDSATAAARADSARALLASADTSGTWIRDIITEGDSVIRRWPASPNRLVRLWLQDGRAVAGWNASFTRAVQDGFDGWGLPDVPVRFLFVADSTAADVPVLWVDKLPNRRLGVTRADSWNDTLVRGSITLATSGSDGRPLSETDIRRTALHEAGHLLGLPHTNDDGSIMAPLASVDAPSARDLNTLRLLYRLPFGSVRALGRRPPDERATATVPPP